MSDHPEAPEATDDPDLQPTAPDHTASSDTPFETIDWDEYWAGADEADRRRASPSGHHVRGLLDDRFAETGVPDSFADVGCGPGVVAFHVAETYPETDVVGYDAAESILAENRDRAADRGLENLSFDRGVLPAFAPDREFDVVLCYGTLAYVSASAAALQALYDAVAPGGTLVLGYYTREGRAFKRRLVENPERHPDPDFDAAAHAERFRLVLEGESTLSYRQIQAALGTWPRSFWEFTDRPDDRWAWNHVPLVWVPK